MKRYFLPLLAACGLWALGAASMSAREKAEPRGSIRPAAQVARVDLPALAKIPFDEALQAARAACPGQVLKAELEVEDGALLYSVEIVGPDKVITEVEIDAGNGRVLDKDRMKGGQDGDED